MQLDLLPEMPPRGDYENINTTIDVSSRYTFAHPVSNLTAENTNVDFDIMTKYDFLPALNKTEMRSVLVSQVKHEVAETLGIRLKHATRKHAKTIGILEWAYATIKTSLKIIGRIQEKMAQIFTHCNIKLQDNLSV